VSRIEIATHNGAATHHGGKQWIVRCLAGGVAKPLGVEQAFSTSAALTQYCAYQDGKTTAAIAAGKRAWSTLSGSTEV
jgi:hypothetical protein